MLQNSASNRVKVNWHSKGFSRYVAANVSFGDFTPIWHILFKKAITLAIFRKNSARSHLPKALIWLGWDN
jgi:hypothetical protein